METFQLETTSKELDTGMDHARHQDSPRAKQEGCMRCHSPNKPWKKVVLPILGAVLLITGIFTGGYFRGIEVGKRARNENGNGPTAEKLIHSQWQAQPCRPTEGCPAGFSNPPLILISFDGFWKGYIERGLSPALQHLAECGIKAEYMRPIFPSKTFPNHFTIVTGLYPESHGIVDNRMFDPQLGRLFKIGKPESLNSVWWEKEPIWVTAEKAGKRTATFFWPGSDVRIKGVRPTYFFSYNNLMPWTCRVETVLAWLDLPQDSRPDFITLYFHEPDGMGHEYGPNSREVNKALEEVDDTLNYLMSGLQERGLLGCVNMMIVGDHGMAETSCDRVILLDQYMNISKVFAFTGSTGRISPKIEHTQGIVDRVVNKLTCKHEHLLVYHKKHLPKRYHYSAHRRIEPIVLDMDSGWLTYKTETDARAYCTSGAHGYDNMAPSMKTVFVAYGPAFKEHLTVKPFLNIELYELMTEVLNMTGQPNNGTKGSLHHMLRNPVPLPDPPPLFYPEECVPPLDDTDPSASQDCDCDKDDANEDPLGTDHPSKTLKDMHAPWKIPAYLQSEKNDTFCLLLNEDYISAYHTEWKIPVWTSFTMKEPEERGRVQGCWRSDRRIGASNSSRCTDFETSFFRKEGMIAGTLFPVDFISSEDHESSVWLLTNAVPVYSAYVDEVGNELSHLLLQWTKKFGSLNVVMGPTFDIHGIGLEPTNAEMNEFIGTEKLPIPTHFFAVVTRCLLVDVDVEKCQAGYLDTLSFLIPHLPSKENFCQDTQHYLLQHSAKVKDVELLTGLQFYTGLPVYDAIRLRTQLPEGLWGV